MSMTSPLQPDAERHDTTPSAAPALLDDAEASWGYECAMPHLQMTGDPMEPGNDAASGNAWR